MTPVVETLKDLFTNWASLACLALLVYFLPAVVADWRGHHNKLAIFVLNLLLGWSFLGWAIALVWACTAVRQEKEVRKRAFDPELPQIVIEVPQTVWGGFVLNFKFRWLPWIYLIGSTCFLGAVVYVCGALHYASMHNPDWPATGYWITEDVPGLERPERMTRIP
jgi:hypothetical protein